MEGEKCETKINYLFVQFFINKTIDEIIKKLHMKFGLSTGCNHGPGCICLNMVLGFGLIIP